MSNVRSWKAIKREVFEQPNNTLIIFEWSNVEHFSKLEDKVAVLENSINDDDIIVCLVWVWAKRSDVFKLDQEDMERLLDND